MRFKELNFQGKYQVLKSWKHKIFRVVLKEFPNVNMNELNCYVTLLLEECHYNPKDNVFYEPVSHYIFNVEMFVQITIEYIDEHPGEFNLL